MIDWDDIRYFLAVAETGSTLAASRVLGVSQSTVLRRIAVLEESLAVRLFDKTRTGYRLVGHGDELLARARDVRAAVTGFGRVAADQEAGLSGALSLATAEGIAYGLISSILDAFHLRYPNLRVTLLLDDRSVDLVQGEADIALRAGRPRKGALVGRKLADGAWAVYASRSYVDRHGAPAEPGELNAHRLIRYHEPLAHIDAARWLDRVAPNADTTSRSNTILGQLLAVKSGVGLACLPVHLGDPDPGLLRVIGPIPELMGEFWLLFHPEMSRVPKVRTFADFIAQEIRMHRSLLLGYTKETYVRRSPE